MTYQFFQTKQWEKIREVLKRRDGEYYPSIENVFRAVKLCQPDETKVVIIGQDPYPTPRYANGLAFSVNPGVPIPASLQNIFKERESDIGIPPSKDGDLSRWARQGVLLLNTSLTFFPDGTIIDWSPFVNEVLNKTIAASKEPLVFILWGNHAKKFNALIPPWHYVIMSAHPSPLSASKGFFGSKPFSKTNAFLGKAREIDWS